MKNVKIKLKRRHPDGAMYFNDHVVTTVDQVLEMSEQDIKDLKTEGPSHWFNYEIVGVNTENKPDVKLKDLTNAELKTICREKGIEFGTKDNKEKLIARILEV